MEKLETWVKIKKNCDFTIHNFPFGIISYKNEKPRLASAIGDYAIDLVKLHESGFFFDIQFHQETLTSSTLNLFIKQGKAITNAVRKRLVELFSDPLSELRKNKKELDKILIPLSKVKNHLPLDIPNYSNIYSKPESKIPNIYNGRASSIIISGEDVYRPSGYIIDRENKSLYISKTKELDFEVNLSFIVGKESVLGNIIDVDKAEEYIFGALLSSNWTARDFICDISNKSFATTISPWLVTIEALKHTKVASNKINDNTDKYLRIEGENFFDINIDSFLKAKQVEEIKLFEQNSKYLDWNIKQIIVNITLNGCNLEIGDIVSTGAIGTNSDKKFILLNDLSNKGTKFVELNDKIKRKYIENTDTIIIKGYTEKNNIRVGFGEINTTIVE